MKCFDWKETAGAILAVLLPVFFTTSVHAGNPCEIKSDKMSLKFAADGKPKSFMADGKELLNEQNPGAGFELKGFDFNSGSPASFRLKNLAFDGSRLTASTGDNVRVTFDVKATDRYIAFQLVRVEGVPKKNLLWLKFTMNVQGAVKTFPLGYMTKVGGAGCDASWPWLWARTENTPLGGFAIFSPASGGEDEMFLHAWTDLGLPVPKAAGPWSWESAQKFFLQEQKAFKDESHLRMSSAVPAAAGAPIVIGSNGLELRLAADGKPESFMAGGKELLNVRDPGKGFVLNGFDFDKSQPVSFPFNNLKFDGKQLVASIGNDVHVVFDVKATDRYITFKISRVDGVPQENLTWMQFKMNVLGNAKVLPLDYMTQASPHGCEINWKWLWDRKESSVLGGFAIYVPTSEEDEDETLLHLWANEGLPHPKVQGEWNLDTARKWLADWQKQFSDQSQMLITAKSNEDLYSLADYATKMDIKRIYMHTDTWRGEYWPIKFSFLHLNPLTFPKGEEDFQKFAKYAQEKGIGLTIHTVSCSIANEDPDYVAGTIDPRLAKWIEGTLEQPVSESDKTISFRPSPGQEMPLNIDRPVTGPEHVDPWNNITTVRIGDEFIKVGSFTDTDKEVWVLKDCQRGAVKSVPSAHEAKAGMIGLIRPYDQVFTADNDSTLVDELGRRMAEFNNRNNIIHCEQDAGEIHTVNHQWGYAKFAQAVYTNLDHPVTSNNSGGSPMPCQLEYKFNSSKTAIAARNQPQVPLMIARSGRSSTGPYEMSSLVAKPIATGVTSVGIYKPEPMFGVSSETLKNHGLSSYAADTVLAWKQAAPLLSEEQRKTILASSDDVIYRATKNGGNLEVVPLRMLFRPGVDIGWKAGSEFGPIVPRQYLKTGDVIEVENPYAAQAPEFVIHVMNGFDGQAKPAPTAGKSDAEKSPEKEILDAYNTGVGIKKTEHPNAKADTKQTLVLQPKAEKIRNPGDHQFSDAGDALRIRFENKRSELVTNEEHLPEFDCSADMSEARGIGLTVTGDGSGAVLVLEAQFDDRRDYVVPLDFQGEREIVIPSGEAAWTDARWGWRMSTKNCRYGTLRKLSIGLGKMPPNTNVDIQVSNIRVLPEIPTALINPIIKVGDGTMKIAGTIASESYLWYQGGDSVGVYDANWNKTADLPVTKQNFLAPEGPLKISIESKDSNPAPWLECQFFVKDTPMVLTANP